MADYKFDANKYKAQFGGMKPLDTSKSSPLVQAYGSSLQQEAAQPPGYALDPLMDLGAYSAISNPYTRLALGGIGTAKDINNAALATRNNDWRSALKSIGKAAFNAFTLAATPPSSVDINRPGDLLGSIYQMIRSPQSTIGPMPKDILLK